MGKRVLVVDDDPVIRVLLKDFLEAMQYTVETLESGVKCLERLASETPDILLLDNQMPVVTGLEVLKRIRVDERLKKLPVIMLSANEETKTLAAAQKADADIHVLKPFELKDILSAIEKLSA